MPLGLLMAVSTLAMPVVLAVITVAVAFEIKPTTDSFKSPTPWKVSLMPAPNALMIWLLPGKRWSVPVRIQCPSVLTHGLSS